MEKISSGAEAIIYRENEKVVKDRIAKNYRIQEIDKTLRQFRTRREAKILLRLGDIGFPSPRLLKSDEKSVLEMQFISGPKIKDILEESDYEAICSEIGRKVAILHNNNIMHGDLTTSNMIFSKKLGNPDGNEVYFIDFGLSKITERIEDKAVDVHLFRQALESKHDRIWEPSFKAFLESYKTESNDIKEILTRYEKIELRGRNKSR